MRMFMNNKIVLLGAVVLLALTGCQTTSLSGLTTNTATVENAKPQSEPLEATGYGISEEKALTNAMQNVIQEYLGALVDTELRINNDEIINEEIITASNGYIDSYKKLSSNKAGGIYTVEIEAIVKHQVLNNKISAMNFSKVSATENQSAEYRIKTSLQNKARITEAVNKVLQRTFSRESIESMMYAQISDVTLLESEATLKKVPVQIDYQLGINPAVYIQKMTKLENTFANLGLKRYEDFDSIGFRYDKITRKAKSGKNRFKAFTELDPKKNYFFIVNKRSREHFLLGKRDVIQLDLWELPEQISLKTMAPWNTKKSKGYMSKMLYSKVAVKGHHNTIVAKDMQLKRNVLNYNILWRHGYSTMATYNKSWVASRNYGRRDTNNIYGVMPYMDVGKQPSYKYDDSYSKFENDVMKSMQKSSYNRKRKKLSSLEFKTYSHSVKIDVALDSLSDIKNYEVRLHLK